MKPTEKYLTGYFTARIGVSRKLPRQNGAVGLEKIQKQRNSLLGNRIENAFE